MIQAVFRPLTEWPGGRLTPVCYRRAAQFRATYASTLDLLERELGYLSARDIVIQIAVDVREIRNDGWPRASARPSHPGVALSFVSRGKPLQVYTDRFTTWEDNLRGIALTLEKLRAIERYGCTQEGRQYTGWAQLPPGEGYQPPAEPGMTREMAAAFLAQHSGLTVGAILADPEVVTIAYQRAAKRLHPDAGGSGEQFLRLRRAVEKLRSGEKVAA
ncbi:MAG TPA: molecular chaperone DnaJ [Armatimonadota bacterium]|nr:molecular chaperone DnaJ [Armatimonadota bacterium]